MPTIEDAEKDLAAKLERITGALRSDLRKIRHGGASTSMLAEVRVDIDGTPTPLTMLASVSAAEHHALLVRPYEPGHAEAIEQAITEHANSSEDLGMTQRVASNAVRVAVTVMTEERRKATVKRVMKRSEEARVGARLALRDSLRVMGDGVETAGLRSLAEQCAAEIETLRSEKCKDIQTI
ncbi:ribosome recycling factor [Streptomyces albogriseolus]|uniref:ribosome recycling factor n=1 Tax=Streptomyces albogriseolus TaxID=1887 RepID=UPI0036F6C3E3